MKYVYTGDFQALNNRRNLANVIEHQTIKECFEAGQPHSMQRILADNRKPAIAARLTSHALSFKNRLYTGEDIKNIFVNSCTKFGYTYFPLRCDVNNIIKGSIKQLRLFVKQDGKYICKACFDVEDITDISTIQNADPSYWTDPSFLKACIEGNAIMKISHVTISNLPDDYLTMRTGKSIYEKAFNGSNPNIWIL